MIKIISDIEKSEYNPKNYNLKGNVLDITNFDFKYNDKTYIYVKHEIKNNENEKDVSIRIFNDEKGIIYRNPTNKDSSFIGISGCFEKLNKNEITLDFFNELQKENLIPSHLSYNDIYENNYKEFFSKQYKNDKETDFFCVNEKYYDEYDESSHYSSEHLFKLNDNVYKLDIAENTYPDEDFNYYGKFNLNLCDPKTGNEKMVFSIIEDNNKRNIVCDKNLLDKDLIEKIKLKDIKLRDKDIQKAKNLQCEIGSNNNIYKINIDDKTYTIKNVKNGNYNDFKDLSKEIVVLEDTYPYDDVHEVNFIYNHNEYCYVSGENKDRITLEFNDHNDLVFEKKKNIVGSGVDVIHYDSKLLDEDFFKALKNNDITSKLFGDKDYSKFCKNAIDVANNKESVDLEK